MSEHYVTYNQVVKKTVRHRVRIELSHCPLCGGEAEFRTGGNWDPKRGKRVGIGVRCKDCGASTPVRQSLAGCPEAIAAELWNRRALA